MRIAVFLAMSVMLVTVSPQEIDLDEITVNGKPCGLEGTANSEGMKDLNRHKNRWALPDESDIDPEVSLTAMLAPGKDINRFDQEKAAKIQGFVIDVKPGGMETCNCGADDPDLKDTHIELALAAEAPEIQRVIVEVTPRLRKLMKIKMPDADWTTPALQTKFKGQWVEVTGWLTFDTAHIKQAENTNPGHEGNWRATCWEIHPVTNITPVAAPEEAKHFQPTSFAALQKLHANHLHSPNAQASIAKMHRTALSKFHQKDVKEAEDEAKERKKQP
jgi:hypothetical protein